MLWILAVYLHECCGVSIVGVFGPAGPAVLAARRASLHALHLQPEPLVLVVGAHREQLVNGRVHRALVRAEHRLDHVVVHVREHRLEIRHGLGELELHCGRHGAVNAKRRHELASRAGSADVWRRTTAVPTVVAVRASAILAALSTPPPTTARPVPSLH